MYTGGEGLGLFKVWDVTTPQKDFHPISTVKSNSGAVMRCCQPLDNGGVRTSITLTHHSIILILSLCHRAHAQFHTLPNTCADWMRIGCGLVLVI